MYFRYLSDLEQQLQKSTSLDEAFEILQQLLNGPFSATEEGEFYEIKGQIADIYGVKFSVNPNEDAPPHFHIASADESAKFAIKDCSILKGNVSPRTRKIVDGFYKHKKSLLIKEWDASRPSDCPVGMYKE